VHTVVRYTYTMETSRNQVIELSQKEKNISFERLFSVAENRLQAIFMFLSVLELVQQNFLQIVTGEGKNNFILEYVEPENRDPDIEISEHSSFE